MMPSDIEIPPSQRDRSLPMIVNLRGDEDYALDFQVDAEGAMELLGIKRSRLTQISGRELRVGRIRRDRYLRPVYRELDLRDYQEWTRATATHQSSSKAIEQAIDSLDDRFSDLFVVLHERLQHFQSQELSWFGQKFSLLRGDVETAFRTLESSLLKVDRDLELQRRQGLGIRMRQEEQLKGDARQSALVEQTDQRLGIFHQDLREVIAAVALIRREQQELRAAWGESAAAARENQNILINHRKTQDERLDTILLTISECFAGLEQRLDELAQATAPSPSQVRVPRRQPRSSGSRQYRMKKPYF